MSATVRLYLVDPAADADEIMTATVSLITTTYTAPSDRIMFATPGTPATDASRTRRDRLAESVFRLGRGATADPDVWSHSDHEHATTVGDLPWPSGARSGLGPQPGNAIAPVTKSTTGRLSGPGSDGVDVIIAGWAEPPASPFAMADFTPVLTLDGIVVILTDSSTQDSPQALHAKQLSRAAALAGLLLTDQLILVHHPPAVHRDAMRSRTIDFGGHRRIHTTASVFRRSTPLPQARHA